MSSLVSYMKTCVVSRFLFLSKDTTHGKKLSQYYSRPKTCKVLFKAQNRSLLLNLFVTLSLMGNKNERTSSYIVLFEFLNMMEDNS